MNQLFRIKPKIRIFSVILVFSLVFTTAFGPMAVLPASAESSTAGDSILKLDEQAPAGLANAKNPYGYPEGVAFTLSKGNELMYYGGWDGSTERKMLNGSSTDELKTFVNAPNKGNSDSSPVPSGTWNWVKAVAFDNNVDSTKEDKVLFVGVEENQKAYAWVLDYSTNTLSNTLELGNMDWIGYDYDQYSSTSLFQVEAGDFDGDGKDTLLLYAPLNLDSDDNWGCLLYEMSYEGGTLSKKTMIHNLLMNQYIYDQNKKTYKDKSDADDTCRDKLAVAMQVGDFNGDNIDDLAVLSYSHYRYSAANTAYYSPQLKICYGNKSFKSFQTRTADETFTVASISGSSLTFPVAVSLAAGDYNGDGYDDLYAVGVKATATAGSSISDISVDGSKWYMHRFNGNLNSKMTDASYTFTDSNAWFEDGFYASDYCYGQVMAAGVAISGNAAPEMLFVGGSLYDVSTGVPIRKAHDNYFDSGDQGLGAVAATNTFVQSVVVGNFDNNAAGREQVAFIIGMKESGHDDYWFESGMICGSNFADTTYSDGSTCYGAATEYTCTDVDSASYIHTNKGDDSNEGLNCFYIVMDHDSDAKEAKYLGVNYAYTDPVVNAVLQAAPYFGDITSAGLNSTTYKLQTTYSSDDTESNNLSGNVGFAAGGSIPFAETANVAIGIKGGFSQSYTESYQTTYEESFSAGGQDVVVVNRTPMLIYRFDYKDGNGNWTGKVQMEMAIPEGPVYTLLSIDDYNDFVDSYNGMMDTSGKPYNALTKIDAAANWMDGNEGNPYAYNENGWADASIEAEQISKGSGYSLGSTGGLVTVSFSEGQSATESFSADVGFYMNESILFGPKSIANFGIELGAEYSHGWGMAETKGSATESSFTVQDLDKETLINGGMEEDVLGLYAFTWTCGGWKRNLGNVDGDGNAVKTPFFGYSLTNISSPPTKVTDLKATNVQEDAVTLSWTKPDIPKGWPSVDGYVIYQGITDEAGNVSYEAFKKIEDSDITSFEVKTLLDGSSVQPNTEYKFMIKSFHKLDSGSAYSDKSNVVTAHTSIKEYTVDLNYDEDAVEVIAKRQDGTTFADGSSLPVGTIIKVEAMAKENHLIKKMVITDNASGKSSEMEATADGSAVIGYYQITGNTTIDIETKKDIKESEVTFADVIFDSNDKKVGSIVAKVGSLKIQSGAIVSDPVTFTATAEDGYVLTEWLVTVDDKEYRYATNDKTEFTLGLVGENIDVKAKFELKTAVKETITVMQPSEGGTIELYDSKGIQLIPDSKGKVEVSYDDKITFKAVPKTGYVIDAWTQDAKNQTGESFVMNIKGDVIIGITYKAPVKYKLTYTQEDEKGNCVVTSPAIASGGAVAAGTEVEMTASAIDGYRVEKWIITKGNKTETYEPIAANTTKDVRNIVVDSSTNVEVSFVEIEKYAINYQQVGEGKVFIVNNSNFVSNGGTVGHASNVILIAKPAEGWELSELDGWHMIVDGVYIKKVENVTEDKSVLIEFLKKVLDGEEDDSNTPGGDSNTPNGGSNAPGDQNDESQKPSTPETGDETTSLGLLLGMMMASVIGMATCKKKHDRKIS